MLAVSRIQPGEWLIEKVAHGRQDIEQGARIHPLLVVVCPQEISHATGVMDARDATAATTPAAHVIPAIGIADDGIGHQRSLPGARGEFVRQLRMPMARLP